jgi:TonB family protein
LFPAQNQSIQPLSTDLVAIEPSIIATSPEAPFISIETITYFSLSISCLLLLKLIFSIVALIRIERRSKLESYNGITIRKIETLSGSFTFFNWIFLSNKLDKNKAEYQAILKHEQAHMKLKHSYDLVFFEIYKALVWWLPSSWYVSKEIKKIHEYQADAYALQSFDINHYSSILIKTTLQSNGMSIVSSFHNDLIFKRLNAMKRQAKKIKLWKIGTLTLLGSFLFVTFACTQENSPASLADKTQTQREIFTIVEEQPSYKGGMDAFYKYVMNEIRYPLVARNSGIEGTVQVQFDIERNGSVSNATAISTIGSDCDKEALRVIENAPGFISGKQRGRTISTRMVLPLTFKLNQEKKNPDNSPQGTVVVGELQTQPKKLTVSASYIDGEWKGTIVNSAGEKLPGVNIVVAGTEFGRVSDLSGSFTVKADQDQELHISCIGYERVVIKQ